MSKYLASLLAVSLPALASPVALNTQTVTADFRQAELQDLAEATTVVSEAQIQARSAEHLEQVLSFAPNVNFASGSSRARFFQIRGVGEESQFIDPVNPSVGLMIDGIDMTGLGTAAALFDVAQVEILRGAQGTRFGANALGGLINIQSAEPEHDTAGYLAGKIGSYHSGQIGGAVSAPLAEHLHSRVAFSHYQSDGYMSNDFLDRSATNGQNENLLRGKLHWQINPSQQIKLVYFLADVDNGYDAFTVDNSRHSLADEPGKDQQNTQALALSYENKISSAFSLWSQLTGSNTRALYSYDEDWVNPIYGELWGKGFDEYQRDYQRFSAEVRLLSNENGRLFFNSSDWVLGLYHQDRNEKLARDYSWNAGSIYRNELTVKATAFYGEITTHFGENTRLIYGLRLENWRNELTDNAQSMNAQNTDLKDRTDEWLYGGKLSLEQDIGQAHLGYLSFARGYKGGGINTAPSISADKRRYDTEYNYNTELGLKSLWLEDSLSTRLAIFYTQRRDQQAKSSYPIPNSPNFQDYFANAAKGESYGLELESRWQLNDWLAWDLSYGYLNARFTDYRYAQNTFDANGDVNGSVIIDKSGRAQLHAPKHSGATALTFALTEAWALRMEAEGKDAFYFEASQDAMSQAYWLYHARLSFTQPSYELAFSARNLLNKDYATRGYSGFNNDSHNPNSDRYVQLGEPRVVMLDARVSF